MLIVEQTSKKDWFATEITLCEVKNEIVRNIVKIPANVKKLLPSPIPNPYSSLILP